MTKIQPPHPPPSPLGGEGWGEGRFDFSDIGQLEFIWDLEFGAWNFNSLANRRGDFVWDHLIASINSTRISSF